MEQAPEVILFILRFPKHESVSQKRSLLGYAFRIVVHPSHEAAESEGQIIRVAVRQYHWQNEERTLFVTGILQERLLTFPEGTMVKIEYTWDSDANGNVVHIGGELPERLRMLEDDPAPATP